MLGRPPKRLNAILVAKIQVKTPASWTHLLFSSAALKNHSKQCCKWKALSNGVFCKKKNTLSSLFQLQKNIHAVFQPVLVKMKTLAADRAEGMMWTAWFISAAIAPPWARPHRASVDVLETHVWEPLMGSFCPHHHLYVSIAASFGADSCLAELSDLDHHHQVTALPFPPAPVTAPVPPRLQRTEINPSLHKLLPLTLKWLRCPANSLDGITTLLRKAEEAVVSQIEK